MSLHVLNHACGHIDTPGGGRDVTWTASCDCGWTGAPRRTSENSEAAALARLDYRRHVEDELGAAAYYTAPVACRNCGFEGEQGVLIGLHVTSERCSRCGTTMLNPNNEAWDDSKASRMGWF